MRVLRALAKVHEHGFHHLVVTGDLTEDGHPGQFEVLAELLDESGIAPERITLIPGTHDLYHQADAWSRAIAGPLAPYAPTSQIDRLLTFEGVAILPSCTAVHQTALPSAGWVSRASLEHLERLLEDRSLSRQPFEPRLARVETDSLISRASRWSARTKSARLSPNAAYRLPGSTSSSSRRSRIEVLAMPRRQNTRLAASTASTSENNRGLPVLVMAPQCYFLTSFKNS